jgi:hypothetical protein
MRIGIGINIPEISNLPGQSGGGAIPDPLVLSYSSSAFCANASDPTPTVTGNVGAGTFSSTAGLVFVSTSTGVIDISASTTSATPYVITYTDTNSATATFNLTLNALDNASFSYSASSFAQNFPDPTPTITGLTDGTFSGTTGLVIDSSTGVIDLDASTIASHTITYDTTSSPSKICPNTSTQTVDIVAALAQVNNVYSMDFDGAATTNINVGNMTAIQGASTFSISAWINVDSTSQQRIFGSWEATASKRLAGFGIHTDNKLLLQISSNGSAFDQLFSTSTIASADPWYHVAVTFSSGTAKFYINGASAGTDTSSINTIYNLSNDYFIGSFISSTTIPFNGKLDELAVFNTALTELEVKKIYYATEIVSGVSKTADLSQLTTPPVKWYRMGD